MDSRHFFELAKINYDLRGNSLKLHKHNSRLEIRRNFFSNRVVIEWNALPQHVVDAPSVNAFKNRLDEFWQDGSE